jgi:predicted ATPase/DNA helicase HerA-like ATPase
MVQHIDDLVESVRLGYSFGGPTLDLGALVVDGQVHTDVPVRIPLGLLNRHGLIAGATGTGKTKTLQLLAEQLSAHGVAVFLTDVKGDLSGVASPGLPNEGTTHRAEEVGQRWHPAAAPVEFYALGGEGVGIPVRARVASFGPTLLSRVLGLKEAQESALGLLFHFAGEHGMPMLDLNDLRSVIQYATSGEGAAELKALGGIPSATVGIIARQIIGLQDQGFDAFFGEPELDTADLLRTAPDGNGVVSCLELGRMQQHPRLFSTCLMWLLADLYRRLPEAGDEAKPRLVFFLDEAHLLFQDASKAFITAIEQTVRLIRSKGVGVFFVTQTAKDVPAQVLGQLGNRIQHAVRAFTPEDAKALRATVLTFPRSAYDLQRLLTELGIGEAVVSVLSERGVPTPVAWTRLAVPQSLMAPTPAEAIEKAVQDSPLFEKYAFHPDLDIEQSGSRQSVVTLVETTHAPSRIRGKKAAPGTNLPTEVTSFVGRQKEIDEVRRLLYAARLVTLTGPGGVGKTRLALRAVAGLEREVADGVWFVDLAPLEDGQLLTHTIAAAVGVRDESAGEVTATLLEYLADKQLILVLDNCEHLVDACAALCDSLLRAAPGPRIMATSRQSLGIAGEHLMVVPPLSIPEPDQAQLPAAELAAYDAVALFIQRATAVSPSFQLTESNASAVARICAMLDGIPLAIELAAVRLRSLSVDQVQQRLEDRFQLLTAGSRTAVPRQRTLRSLIYWSYELCTAEERVLWARASVFAGDFDLAAAEAVCAGADVPAEDVMDILDGLIDKSILSTTEQDGALRYRMLESLRAFGLESLATSDDRSEMLRRHRDYYARLAAEASEQWFGPDQVSWFTRLQAEQANLRIALEFCVTEPDEAPAGLALAANLWPAWIAGGKLSEGRHWIDRALVLAPEPSRIRGSALWVAAWAASFQGDIAATTSLLAECRAIAQQHGDEVTLAYADQVEGLTALTQGDVQQGVTTLERALAGHRDAGSLAGSAYTLFLLAGATSWSGDTERTVALCEEGLALSQANGESWSRSWTTWVLGYECAGHGDYGRAAALTREAIQLKRAFDDRLGIGHCVEVLAWAAAANGQHERAGVLLGAAHEIRRAVGVPLRQILVDGHAQCEANLREVLGDHSLEAAIRRGAELTFDQALSYALEAAGT